MRYSENRVIYTRMRKQNLTLGNTHTHRYYFYFLDHTFFIVSHTTRTLFLTFSCFYASLGLTAALLGDATTSFLLNAGADFEPFIFFEPTILTGCHLSFSSSNNRGTLCSPDLDYINFYFLNADVCVACLCLGDILHKIYVYIYIY